MRSNTGDHANVCARRVKRVNARRRFVRRQRIVSEGLCCLFRADVRGIELRKVVVRCVEFNDRADWNVEKTEKSLDVSDVRRACSGKRMPRGQDVRGYLAPVMGCFYPHHNKATASVVSCCNEVSLTGAERRCCAPAIEVEDNQAQRESQYW